MHFISGEDQKIDATGLIDRSVAKRVFFNYSFSAFNKSKFLFLLTILQCRSDDAGAPLCNCIPFSSYTSLCGWGLSEILLKLFAEQSK